MSVKGIAAAVGLTFLTACTTTPQEAQPLSAPVEKSETGLLGEKDPVTGCYKKKSVDGSSVYELCPSPKEF